MKKKLLMPIVSLLSLVALAANDPANIYEIWPWKQVSGTSMTGSGVLVNPYNYDASYASGSGTAADPITGGKFYFVIRLLNSGWSVNPTATVPWDYPSYKDALGVLHPAGSSVAAEDWKWTVQWALNPPKFGVTVGGRVAWAEIEYIVPDTYINSSSANSKYYTDIVCSYTVKNSDLALPVCLANTSGAPATLGSAYSILNSDSWVFVNTNKADAVVFDFVNQSLLTSTPYKKPEAYTDTTGRLNYDLSRSRINVKTLDFAESSYDVPLGDTRSSLVSIVINGTPEVGADESLGKLYAWPEDPTAVNVPGGEYEIVMDGTSSEYFIPVDGVTLGKSTKLILSQFPRSVYTAWTNDLRVAGASIPADETVLTTLLTATEPPANTLTVKPDSTTAVATGDRYTASTWLDISLLSNCTNTAPGLSVNLTPTLEGTFDSTKTWEDYIRLSDKESLTALPAVGESKTNVLIQTGFQKPATSDRIYVYVLRSDDNNTKVKFIPDYPDYRATALELKANPSISSLQVSASGGITKGKTIEFKVAMTDALADEKATGYSMNVVYDNGTSSSSRQFNGLALTNGMLRVQSGTDYKLPSDTMPLSGTVTITVTVKSPLSGEEVTTTTTVGVSDFDVKATVDGLSDVVCAEGDILPVTITLPTTSAKDLYAFLVCTNQESAIAAKFTTNSFVVCNGTDWLKTSGISIPAGQQTNKSKFTVLDNTPEDDATWFFDVVVCTNKTYSPAAIYSDFTSTTLSLAPTNVPAAIRYVVACETNVNNDVIYRAEANASLGYVPEGKSRTFKLDVNDTAYDCSTNMVVKWSVYQTSTDAMPITNKTFTVTNGLDDAKFTYRFAAANQNADANRYYIKAEVRDKDTADSGMVVSVNEITIRSSYSITVSASSQTIYENNDQAYITVGLNGWDNRIETPNGLTVKVDVVPYKLGDPNQGVFELDWPETLTDKNGETNTYYVTFYGEGKQTLPVKSETLDGTRTSGGSSGGYRIYASVTNDTVVLPTSGEKASDYYRPFNAETQPQSVRVIKALSNIQPSFLMTNGRTTEPNSETNAWKVAGGSAQPIRWEITDCEADTIGTTNFVGLKVTFEGPIVNATNLYVNATNDNLYGLFRPDFGSLNGGKVSVNVFVEDKDGGMSETLTYWYEIQPAKFLTTVATGPSSGDVLKELSRLYRSQEGIGKGRTYVSGSGVSGDAVAEAFKLRWNCGTAASVKIWGYGYRHGDTEGSLANPGMGDIALDVGGNNLGSSGTPYQYAPSTLCDSFFYGWITATEPGGSEYQIAVNPEDGATPVGDGELKLPTDLTGDEVGYLTTYAEAVFSKEWQYQDNLGDINNDGIPDIFALKTYKKGALAQADGAGSELVAVDSVNDDDDYMPTASQLGKSTLIPGAVSGWESKGIPYSAYYELRGYHEGLNYGMFKFNDTERDGGWVSVLNLSDNEKRSLISHAMRRRDAILTSYREGDSWKNDIYRSKDWDALTNLLANTTRAGTSHVSGSTVPALPAYILDYEASYTNKTPYFVFETTVTNEIITVTNVVEMVPYISEITNNYRFISYTPIGSTNTVVITNMINAPVNGLSITNTDVLAFYTPNPGDELTLDDINVGEFLNQNFYEDHPAVFSNQQAAARAYIDRTWEGYTRRGWGWTCENRTDPTVEDTDGDGIPDGYEYFLWYDAVVGTQGTNLLVGCRFDRSDIESREDVISSEDIAKIYNPNIKGTNWKSLDTDKDGISDYEEFLIGTSPVDWDTDRDGLSDLYEVIYNINPLTTEPGVNDGTMNGDGDFMAFAHDELTEFAPYSNVYKATDGKLWMLFNDFTTQLAGALIVNPETNSVSLTGFGFQVASFNGGYIPTVEDTSRGNFGPNTVTIEVDPRDEVVTGKTVSFYHSQVYNYFGFDPRTAWYRNSNGSCSPRFGSTTAPAENTSAFSAKDEYLLLKFRYIVGLRSFAEDTSNLNAGRTTIYNIILSGTTNPNKNFSGKNWGDSETSYTQNQHGADTDGDGVPDGWELYLGVDPNRKYTIAKGSTGYDELYYSRIVGNNEVEGDDGDGLGLAAEYAGTDSCGFYSDCATVYANYPTREGSLIKGWVNKYWPTNPMNRDTDGDGLDDSIEGKNWAGDYTINRWGQDGNRSKETTTISGVRYFMIYGEPEDNETTCVKGGGYNPCTIDTDGDGLPDPWEYQYAGILFLNDEIVTEANTGIEDFFVFDPDNGLPTGAYDDLRAAASALGWDFSVYTNNVLHVVMGQDGTVSDAYSFTGYKAADRDWDGDGLQNWQEYLVQAMRHFRYDDCKTPLLGRDIPVANRQTGLIDEGAWNGDKGFPQISVTSPLTSGELQTLEELGYTNFVSYVRTHSDYLRTLGYFAAPPRTWDPYRGYDYMLPPSAAVETAATDWTEDPVQGTNTTGYTLWAYCSSNGYTNWVDAATYTGIVVTNSLAKDSTGNDIGVYRGPAPVVPYAQDEILLWEDKSGTNYYVAVDTSATNLVSGIVSNYYFDTVARLQVGVETNTVGLGVYSSYYGATKYVGTDPRLWDTDEDGMDDYYELFHGLNPILGNIGLTPDSTDNAKDVISTAYGHLLSAWRNGWVGWDNTTRPAYDAIKYPWMIGEGLCDADGDGLRNEEESITANLTPPMTYHTDPTPLWMTDATVGYTNYVGVSTEVLTNDTGRTERDPSTGVRVPVLEIVTNQVFGSAIKLFDSPSFTSLFYENHGITAAFAPSGAYYYSFEENEGYDTDNDWRSDSIEMRQTAEPTSDPLDSGDVVRRQSIWFGGATKPGAAISYEPTRRHTYGYDFYKQFTVEAWIMPNDPKTGVDQYVVSRASNYPGWDADHPGDVIRMNFALGIDKNGEIFGEMQDSAETDFRLSGGNPTSNKWTHVAATFDGSTFTLYVDGKSIKSQQTTLIPANGVTDPVQDPQFTGGFPYEKETYTIVPSITILGARANGAGAFDVGVAGSATAWTDIATNFFAGSVAEVRIWDGARSEDTIAKNYNIRFDAQTVKDLRLAVYNQYNSGKRRNAGNLDPELVQHYGFGSLPGATEAKYVQKVPAGFKANVLNLVRNPATGVAVDDAILNVGWWTPIATNSAIGSVYSSPHVVPWIENTVSHLPRLCGSLADSVYWSENFAGFTPAKFHTVGGEKLEKFNITNSMNPYNIVNLGDEEEFANQKTHRLAQSAYAGGGATAADNTTIRNKYLYDARMRFSGTTDLVPLGSAFAKRLGDSWDGLGAEDAWAMTTKAGEDDGDLSDSGIPQWAKDLGFTTREAYLAALARGLMPDGSYIATFTREHYFTEVAKNGGLMADENGNGLPDWWETYFGIYGSDANGDEDNDGLTNYQEFFVSFGDYTITTQNAGWSLTNMVARNDGMIVLCPTNAYSDASAATVDYFFRPDFTVVTDSRVAKNSYIGEMVGDHDFMETWWENGSSLGYANAAVYDPQIDTDGDGWSNYGEARSYSWHGGFIPELVDSYYAGSTGNHSDAHPTPSIGIRATYYGTQDVSGKSLVVRTRSGQRIRTDATFVVNGSEGSASAGLESYQMIGTYPGQTTVRGTLHPGCIVPGSTTKFEMRRIDAAPVYYWTCATCESYTNYWDYANWRERHDYSFAGESELGYGKYVGTESQYRAHAEHHLYANQTVTSTSTAYEIFARTSSDSDGQKGVIVLESSGSADSVAVGSIDFHTGEYEIDFAKVAAAGISLDGMVIRAAYQYNVGNEWPQTVWVSDPSDGWVREGRNTVEAFLDIDNNGVWSVGEPYGMLKDVEIGWRGTGEPVVIELKDESPVMTRTAVSVAGGEGSSAVSAKVVVRRTAINGVGSLAPVRTLASRTVVGDDRAYLTEADVVTLTNPDLDWTWLSRDAEKAGVAVESATYDIVRVDAFDDGSSMNSVLGTFTRTFGPSRSVPTALAPVDGAPVYSAQPTFVFGGDDTMTAYCLQVSNETGKVWTSEARALPGRVPYTVDNGKVYMVSPELYVGTFASTNGSFVVLDGSNYYWRVALMNSKFSSVDDPSCWSDWAAFQMDVGNNNLNPDTQTGYGSVAAVVRYYGPGAVVGTADGFTNIVVEAYSTPDFTGIPLARTRVAVTTGLDSAIDVTTANSVLQGIEPGVVYLLAYVDSNNNCVRDAWESWGYAARIGEGVPFMYSPVGALVTDGATDMPTVAIFIEDTDVNQNEIPDILELNVVAVAVASGADVDADGISDSDEENDYGTDPFAWDTDGDGMPDGWEAKFGQTDPLAQDGDTVGIKDVMAYAVADLQVAVTTNALGEIDARYVMIPYGVESEFTTNRFYKTFDYNGQLAMGAPAGDVANIRSVEVRSVIVVHGGVYDLFGFEPTTANPEATSAEGETAAYGVNTKPFTALDKYLVVRYLESFGLADEVAMNTNGTWSASTLRPGYYDSDANNLPDGWELYMNFASVSSTAPALRITDAAHLASLTNAFAAAGELIRNPYDDHYFYNLAVKAGAVPEMVGAYDNAFAIANGLANATAEEQEAFWSYAPAKDVMAIFKGEMPTVTDASGKVYVANERNGALYATTNLNGRLVVTKKSVADYTATGAYQTGVMADVVLIHSAVYDFFGFDPATALEGEATVDAEGNEVAAAAANTAPFTRLWKQVTKDVYLPAVDAATDVKPEAEVTDSNANMIPDGWELYVRYADGETFDKDEALAALKGSYDPYDDYYLYNQAAEAGFFEGDLAMVPAYTNAVAVAAGFDSMTAEEFAAYWNDAPAKDVMAIFKGEMPTVVSNGTVYVGCLTNGLLYATTNVNGQLIVTKPTGISYSASVDDPGSVFEWGAMTNVVVMHSAVYDFFGYDPTTALPDKEGVPGVNTAPFTRLWKQVTADYYLPVVDPGNSANFALDVTKTDSNGNAIADGFELYIRYVLSGEYLDAIADASAKGGFDPYGPMPEELVSNSDDVMAYAVVSRKLVLIGADESTAAWYSLPLNAKVAVNDNATTVAGAKTTYTYGNASSGLTGEGALAPSFTTPGAKVLAIKVADVVLVHAQVYFEFGFNPNTANHEVDESQWVNTKRMTFSDKKYVADYLSAIGTTTPSALHTSSPDTDGDGIPDGWELYIMFNPVSGIGGTPTHSPWNSADRTADSDGDGLDTLGEWSEGIYPTDPWNTDTDDDGIDDYYAYMYHLKSGQFDDDPDRDGLSNYQEYLISVVYTNLVPRYTLDPDNAHSVSAAVTDYFLRNNNLYYGELFADHDQIEDWWEDEQPAVLTFGGTSEANYSRYVYDANRDVRGNGWDNWSLARAWFHESYTSNVVSSTVNPNSGETVVTTNVALFSKVDDNGGNPTPTLHIRVTYNGERRNLGNSTTKYQLVIKAWGMENVNDPQMLGKPDKIWGKTVPSQNSLLIDGALSGFSPTTGAVRPGKNMFVAYVAEGEFSEGSAAPDYVPGMPYGVAMGVDVGPISSSYINIEMTDFNPSIPRINIPEALKIQDEYASIVGDISDKEKKGCFERIATTCTDRGLWATDQLTPALKMGKDTHGAASNELTSVKVSIVRSGINDAYMSENGKFYYSGTNTLIERTFPVGVHNVLTEADFLSEGGEPDLDWGGAWAAWDAEGRDFGEITNTYYRIVLFDGPTTETPDNNNLCAMFVNKFEHGAAQSPVDNMNVDTYSGQPTFVWTHTNTIAKAYPAFQLRVWSDKSFDQSKLVFDSGVLRAPSRDAQGRYKWTAPLWTGCMTKANVEFKAGETYYWSVSMLDAKFTEPCDDNETLRAFSMQKTSPSGEASDYGMIPVKVKYMGPGSVATSTYKGCLRIEAFSTPDFKGVPYGAAYISDLANLTNENAVVENAVITGLPTSQKYYVRAYIDSDGDGELDPWESWGYVCHLGDQAYADFYSPRAIEAGNAVLPENCVIYVEDSDTNCNMIPDIWEYEHNGSLDATKSLTPYIAYSSNGDYTSHTNAIATVVGGQAGAKATLKKKSVSFGKLAYASALESVSSGTVTAPELMLLGVNINTSDSAHIKISSFTLEEGMSLEVVVDDSIDAVAKSGLSLNNGHVDVTVECATTLAGGGDWKGVGETVRIMFPLTAGTFEIPAKDLSAINDAMAEASKECGGSCYFRVKAVASEK